MSNREQLKQISEVFNIDPGKDINSFLKEMTEDPDFEDFIEVQKRLKNVSLRDFLVGLVLNSNRHLEDYFNFITNGTETIFELKEAFDSYQHLIYYLVDDEALILAEIDYDWKSTFEIGEGEDKETLCFENNDKLHVLCTGLWNYFKSDYDFFIQYLNEEIKCKKEIAMYESVEVTKVNSIRYHCFNTTDGVKDFTNFIKFADDNLKVMRKEYSEDQAKAKAAGKSPFHIEPSYIERCTNILSKYLDSIAETVDVSFQNKV